MAYTLLVVLIVLVAILMIFIVLIQESKGGGLASNFSSTNSIMGVRKTTDIVEKLTWGLACSLGCHQRGMCLCSPSGSWRKQCFGGSHSGADRSSCYARC